MAGEREEKVLRAVLGQIPVDTGLFSPGFLLAVPRPQLEAALAPIRGEIGEVLAIAPKGGMSYAVTTATHEMLVDIVLDADDRIVGLLLKPPFLLGASLAELVAALAAPAPDAAWLVTHNDTTLFAHDADRPLATGSAFKLGVLAALRAEIDAGKRRWSDVVSLGAEDISLPSGMLHTWPVGTTLTLDTLASLMISISDNTATDTLMHLLGADAVEAALGIAPVLTTRQLFTLKSLPAQKVAYGSGDLATRRSIIAGIAGNPLPEIGAVSTPHDPGVEYELSPARLCALIGQVADLGAVRINPGVAVRADWAEVAFKGGSEIGVLNLTTQMIAHNGDVYRVSASWNAPGAIDEARASAAYAGVLSRLAREAADR